MRNAMIVMLTAGLAASAAFAGTAPTGPIRITEAMSSSGAGGTVDWIELTNFSNAPVNIGGYRIDDSSFSFALSQALNGVTSIGPGESVVFIESAAGAAIGDFRTFWGGLAGVQVGYYSGSGLGLSSGGDGVSIFAADQLLIDLVNFGAATGGVSFGYDPKNSDFGALSVNGVFGAFVSPNAVGNVASPGTVPGPAAAGLLGLAGLVAGRRRRA